MPLYLVRWPTLTAALVSAADEDELLDILDETANPEGCTWSLYRGPFYLEFPLNVDYSIKDSAEVRELLLEPSELQIKDVSRVCERDVMSAVIDLDSETAAEMVDAIVKQAFPALDRVLGQYRDTLPEDEVRRAVRAELDALVRASWQHQQTKRRPDSDSRVTAMMETAPRLVAHWTRPATETSDSRTHRGVEASERLLESIEQLAGRMASALGVDLATAEYDESRRRVRFRVPGKRKTLRLRARLVQQGVDPRLEVCLVSTAELPPFSNPTPVGMQVECWHKASQFFTGFSLALYGLLSRAFEAVDYLAEEALSLNY
jgi:hypothetical protein